MICTYPNANKLHKLHACEAVFDRVVLVVAFEHDTTRCGRHRSSTTHGLPGIRTRNLSSLGRADTFFILEPSMFIDLFDFISERTNEKSTIHLLGQLPKFK